MASRVFSSFPSSSLAGTTTSTTGFFFPELFSPLGWRVVNVVLIDITPHPAIGNVKKIMNPQVIEEPALELVICDLWERFPVRHTQTTSLSLSILRITPRFLCFMVILLSVL